MTRPFKADLTAEGALIQADYCLDHGDDVLARRWTLIGRVQQTLVRLWSKYHAAWTPTQLRRLHMMKRMRHARFEANGVGYYVEATFALAQVLFVLVRVTPPTASPENYDSTSHKALSSRAVYRKTVLKNPAAGLRTVAVDLVRCAEL